MDTTDSLIQFDEKVVIDYCNNFQKNIKPSWPLYNSIFEELKRQAIKIIPNADFAASNIFSLKVT